MADLNIDLSNIDDVDWAVLAKLAKRAMVLIAAGGVTTRQNGREITRMSFNDAKALYEMALDQQTVVNNPGDGGIIQVNFPENY